MQLEVNNKNIVLNVAKAEVIAEQVGATVAVMVKDFYSCLGIQNIVQNRIWSSKGVNGSYNYILFQNDIKKHKGGLIVTIYEAKKLSILCKMNRCKFQGFIPVNMGDDREGLSKSEAIELFFEAKKYENNYFTLNSICITNGCLNDDLVSAEELRRKIVEFRLIGIDYVSVGGSYYLGKVLEGADIKGINEIRIGEFAIYGTIPFHDGEGQIGLNALELDLEIIKIYEDRHHVLLKGGSSQVDTDLSVRITQGYKFVSVSTEYTILKYDKKPLLGSSVTFIPNYHSLIKLLN